MKYYLGTQIVISQPNLQRGVIHNYGDLVWEWITNEFHGPEPFTVRQATKAPCLAGLAPRTQVDIVRLVIRNVQNQPGSVIIYRIGKRYFWA